MTVRATSGLSQTSFVRRLLTNARLALRLMREPRVPRLFKALPVLAVLYVISPVDLSPDLVPLIGQIDDLAVILIALEIFLKVCPRAAVAFHKAAISRGQRYWAMSAPDDIIDAEWRRG